MHSSTLKNWTVALAAGAAVVVAGVAVAQSPAFTDASDRGDPAAVSTEPGAEEATASSAPPRKGLALPTGDGAVVDKPPEGKEPSTGETPAATGDAPQQRAEGAENGTAAQDGTVAAADAAASEDPFKKEVERESDTAGETAFDPDTIKTDYQCAPPALSPAALLVELKRTRARQTTERKRIEKTKAEIVALNAQLVEKSEAIEKKLVALAAAHKAAEEQMAAAKKAADEKAQAAAVAALKAKAEREADPKSKMSPEERAASAAARRIEVQRLAATTKGMQAGEAARFLGALDAVLAANVIAQMKPKLAGAALAKMKPSRAAKIATLVVEKP